ncbi:hypothetical protein B0H16DRAFT_1465336 [Mycena metata]|uniref:Uncharacterized protein n=1 Tax=Mycena metata TaxID=1033252 RepID=A0AAD7IBH4_9AGAR|nr:hypothetical protein B0H16DRAFT_1465336 [Mycena metata]
MIPEHNHVITGFSLAQLGHRGGGRPKLLGKKYVRTASSTLPRTTISYHQVNQQKFQMKKGENKSGLNRHQQPEHPAAAEQVLRLAVRVQALIPPRADSGQDRASGLPMAILGQSGGISSEDDGEVSEIPRVSTEGGVASSGASSKDIKTQWKQRNCKKAKLTWQGLRKLAQVIKPMVPKPFDTPLTIFNVISDAAEKYFDNEKDLKDMMEQSIAVFSKAKTMGTIS